MTLVRHSVRHDGPSDGLANMAADAAMLDRAEAGEGSIRVYTWSGAWVSLGRHQHPDRTLLPGAPVQSVSRPTGGKAVLHGHDVTVAWAAPLSLLGLAEGESRSVAQVYRWFAGPLVAALTRAGIPSELAERTQFVRSAGRTADCFAHISPNDIVDPRDGHKTCGCALRITHSAALIQASIPITSPLVPPASVFRAAHNPRRALKFDLDDIAERIAAALGHT